MGRKRKSLNPSQYYQRGDLALNQRLNEPIVDPAPLSKEQIDEVEDALIAAGFAQNRTRPRNLILAALANTLDYQKVPYKPYVFKKLTRATFGADRPKGAHQKEHARMLLIAAIFLAWRIAFKEEPRVSRKIVQKDLRTIRSPFVVFAGQILTLAKIGKVEDNLNAFLAYERATPITIEDEQ